MSETVHLSQGQAVAMRRALTEAWERQVGWSLPDLVSPEDRGEMVATLVRDRALTLIESELVGLNKQRARRAPWGDHWAQNWWEQVILPAARDRVEAGWWLRRSPREALSWAIVLDPIGAGEAGRS